MEAPGIHYKQGRLDWLDDYRKCNSNDGKRSEWVAFLTKGETVQLLPRDIEAAVRVMRNGIYGVSLSGRPLGSEPRVVCQYRLVESLVEVVE
jgi:hypothetical protein